MFGLELTKKEREYLQGLLARLFYEGSWLHAQWVRTSPSKTELWALKNVQIKLEIKEEPCE